MGYHTTTKGVGYEPYSPMYISTMHSDKWFEDEVLPQLTGFAWLVRYADDFVVCFENEEEARVFGDELRRHLGKFGLTISEETSKIIEFGRSCMHESEAIRLEMRNL